MGGSFPGKKNFGGTDLGSKTFGPLQKFRLTQLLHSQHFGVGVKIYQIILERRMVISADFLQFFCMQYFKSSREI